MLAFTQLCFLSNLDAASPRVTTQPCVTVWFVSRVSSAVTRQHRRLFSKAEDTESPKLLLNRNVAGCRDNYPIRDINLLLDKRHTRLYITTWQTSSVTLPPKKTKNKQANKQTQTKKHMTFIFCANIQQRWSIFFNILK